MRPRLHASSINDRPRRARLSVSGRLLLLHHHLMAIAAVEAGLIQFGPLFTLSITASWPMTNWQLFGREQAMNTAPWLPFPRFREDTHCSFTALVLLISNYWLSQSSAVYFAKSDRNLKVN